MLIDMFREITLFSYSPDVDVSSIDEARMNCNVDSCLDSDLYRGFWQAVRSLGAAALASRFLPLPAAASALLIPV